MQIKDAQPALLIWTEIFRLFQEPVVSELHEDRWFELRPTSTVYGMRDLETLVESGGGKVAAQHLNFQGFGSDMQRQDSGGRRQASKRV